MSKAFIPHQGPCSRRVFQLIRSHKQGERDGLRVETLFLELISELVASQKPLLRRIESLPWKRQATRVELFRRVNHARDYIHALWRTPISIPQIAAAACLSPYHFVRAFKEIHGIPPHAYVSALRVRRAQRLLRDSDLTVLQISHEAGFESPTAFSGAFRRAVGLGPRAYRQARRTTRNKQE